MWEDLTHDKLETLTLSFRSLAAIANLGSLRGLRTLRLDNNSISVIEGLDDLPNLTWLDLSFNDIEVRACGKRRAVRHRSGHGPGAPTVQARPAKVCTRSPRSRPRRNRRRSGASAGWVASRTSPSPTTASA